MIKITQFKNKWRIAIGEKPSGETWEFEDLEDLTVNLNMILTIKNDYGRLENHGKE